MTDKQIIQDVGAPELTNQLSRTQRFKSWYKAHKKLSVPLSVAAGLLIISITIYAIPVLRYATLAPFVHRAVDIYIFDTVTKTPIHDATVMLDGQTQKTTTKGQVHFNNVPVGARDLTVTKALYDTQKSTSTIPVFGSTSVEMSLKANGRRIVVTVTDRLSSQPLEGVTITAGKASGATKANGRAEIVVPIDTTSINALAKKEGYLQSNLTLTKESSASIQLVKAGRIYFLSKQSGTVDVVSTNFDGSYRKVILKGSGNENDSNTSLLASRDWRYLVLYTKRDTTREALYLIDTQNPQPTRITDGSSFVTAVGWSSHRFIYKEHQAEPGGYADNTNWRLHSVRASDKSVATLEKSETLPLQYGGSAYQYIGTPYILDGDTIVYSSYWQKENYYSNLPTGHESGVIAVQADGSSRRFIKTYPSAEISYIETKLYKPQEIHYRVFNANGERRENIMTVDKKIEIVPPSQQKFDQDYPTFLISPDGKRAFWAESRDGKNTLFIGNHNSGESKQLTTLSEYTAYGWFTDDYILLQKGGSELFITTPDALKSGSTPLKISDYHKPDRGPVGYGYGYGGQ